MVGGRRRVPAQDRRLLVARRAFLAGAFFAAAFFAGVFLAARFLAGAA